MRCALLGLSLLVLNSCDTNQKAPVNKQTQERAVNTNNLDIKDGLLFDIDYWMRNGIKPRDKIVILKRCGYEIKRGGWWGVFTYITDGNSSVPFNSNIDWPINAQDIERFIASYNQ